MFQVCEFVDGKYMFDVGFKEFDGKKKEVVRDYLKVYFRMFRFDN